MLYFLRMPKVLSILLNIYCGCFLFLLRVLLLLRNFLTLSSSFAIIMIRNRAISCCNFLRIIPIIVSGWSGLEHLRNFAPVSLVTRCFWRCCCTLKLTIGRGRLLAVYLIVLRHFIMFQLLLCLFALMMIFIPLDLLNFIAELTVDEVAHTDHRRQNLFICLLLLWMIGLVLVVQSACFTSRLARARVLRVSTKG